MWNYLWNVGVWLSQGINTVILGGAPDETLSAAAGGARRIGSWWGCALCWLLDKLDSKHCERSLEKWLADKEVTPEEVTARVIAIIAGVEDEIRTSQDRLSEIRRLVAAATMVEKLRLG